MQAMNKPIYYNQKNLTEAVKSIGQTIIDNAEEISKMMPLQKTLVIKAEITPDSLPELTCTKSFYALLSLPMEQPDE